MKRSEELFMTINDIDDDIIDEAKLKAETPVQMKPEPRSPIKGIIALAACIAVLAVGVFALVRFKLNNPDPVQPDQSDQSNLSDSDISFDFSIDEDLTDPHPEIELTFTEEDRELQAMLRELTANVNEIDGMFNNLSTSGKAYTFKFNQYITQDYYLIPQDQRTANGIFPVPQSYDEMEQLVSRYFSPIAAEFYMNEVSRGTTTENSDGTFDIKTTSSNISTFIEINGRMYARELYGESDGTGIDCETARVISRSEKSIRFSYRSYEYDRYSETIEYPLREGIIVLENGTPKLHFYGFHGFLSEFPAEYTDRDLELQELFKAMAPGYDLAGLFAATRGGEGDQYIFFLPEKTNGRYFYDISTPELKNKYPQSISELEETLLKYFTQGVVDHYMSQVCRGTMTANADGTYNVTLDKDMDMEYPTLVEIDGKLFQSESVASGRGGPWYSTAKVIEQTEDTIIFSCTWASIGAYVSEISRFRYERGDWRWDLFYRSENEPETPTETAPEYTDSDRALQALLAKLVSNANEVHNIFVDREPNGEAYLVRNNYPPYYGTDTYYLVSDDMKTSPSGSYSFPQSIDEMRAMLRVYFTEDAVKRYIEKNTDICTLDVRNGTTLDVKRTDERDFRAFLEIDGSLYYKPVPGGDADSILFDTVRVIRRNKNIIEFEYDEKWSGDKIIRGLEGTIVYENGSWKLNYYNGFITAVPTEFSDEDLELQAILAGLAPGKEAADWFAHIKTSPYSTLDEDIFEFLLSDHRSTEEYVLLPQGTLSTDSSIKYPHTCEELEAIISKYLTQRSTGYFLKNIGKGTMTANPDGTYSVMTDILFPDVLEIDGRLYFDLRSHGKLIDRWDTAQVISKTDDTIRFSYLEMDPEYNSYYSRFGLIKYERGSWRLSLYPNGRFDLLH